MNNTRAMGRKKLNRERINITLPRGMADELAAAAEERGWDRSRLVEELARAYLKKWKTAKSDAVEAKDKKGKP